MFRISLDWRPPLPDDVAAMAIHLDELEQHHHTMIRRKRRLRRLLRKLPRRSNLARYPILKWFAHHARKAPFLWSFKRQHVMASLYLGSVLAFLPLYGIQGLLAFGAALLGRGNLTVMVALQFITNPLTILPIYGFTGWVGLRTMEFVGVGEQMHVALQTTHALFIGGVIVGLLFAVVSDLVWRLLAWEARIFRERLAQLRERHRHAEKERSRQRP